MDTDEYDVEEVMLQFFQSRLLNNDLPYDEFCIFETMAKRMILKKSKEQNRKTTPDEFLIFQKDNLSLIEQLKGLKENCILDKKKFTPLFQEMMRLNILLMSMK